MESLARDYPGHFSLKRAGNRSEDRQQNRPENPCEYRQPANLSDE